MTFDNRRWLPVTTLAALWWSATAGANEPEDTARIRRAIVYLDARQEAWSQFAKAERGEGAGKTTCVSCHTGLSDTLARPALRPFAVAPGSTDIEAKARAGVSLRVEHWAELDSPRYRLMYDSSGRKKAESRGTEAVLSALVLARDDAAHARAAASEATQTAMSHLWATQAQGENDAGSWDWLNFGLEPWEADDSRAFGAALAAIAVGSAPQYLDGPLDADATRGVRLLRDYLRRRFPEESLHNRLWILEASVAFDDLLAASQKQPVIDEVIALQNDDGGWGLAPLGDYERVDGTAQTRESDGYATGLVLYALLRSRSPVASAPVARGLAWLRSHQQADGSWPGRSVNKERDPATFVGKLMSDAATARAAAVLAEAGLKGP